MPVQRRATLTAAGQKQHQLPVRFFVPRLDVQEAPDDDDTALIVALLDVIRRHLPQGAEHCCPQFGLLGQLPRLEQRRVTHEETFQKVALIQLNSFVQTRYVHSPDAPPIPA